MAIMNYTTTVKPERTVAVIQDMLRKAGAKAVLCEYLDDGRLDYIAFRIDSVHGPIFFKLPARVDGVLRAMKNDKSIPRSKKTAEQAERVAWRIVKDWVECQLALVESEQADLEQVFLQYAQSSDGRTLYEHFVDRGLPLLTKQ